MIQLQNDILTAKFKLKGAELCSLQNSSNIEYIWEGNPAIWGRHAPVLFPIVGKLHQNTYRVNGKTYTLPQHGFARDREFEVINQTEHEVTFELNSDVTSLEVYPFEFQLQINYQLIDDELKVSYRVKNTGEQTAYFSIGAHPGFTCPLYQDEKRSDYSLLFSATETSEKHLLEGGLFNGKTIPSLNNTNHLAITNGLFDQDALVFDDLKSDTISIADGAGNKTLSVNFKGFPYMGIWSKNESSPFICIEPWYGKADNVASTGELAEKEGIQQLNPEEIFNCSFSIIIHK